ncbi:hypothetical protein PATSB16_20840 [Pandoraea thiooxydans]|uniref:Uncharacterized protein n=1 Tax=Pandoraea thiooxydans TaxID=445709 RepID=A0A0G3EM44_9BURK|nr:hypothetical protein [Pandoraea thiooxydans]AKJ68143.1 hypothetical protein ABW99_07890 [Pandoraea thiooxydans]APR95424.1 hypothetical protein PATSB16_20840 [Pandoraea thiooxydans]
MNEFPRGGGSYSPDLSPYDVGTADLWQAQADLKQLNSLKLNVGDYKTAEHGWGGYKIYMQKLIGHQTQLEDDVSKSLSNIAAAYQRGEISPSVVKRAQVLSDKLLSRLLQDSNKATQADRSGNSSLAWDAYMRDQNAIDKSDALNDGCQPDAVRLVDTPLFERQAATLDKTIAADINTYEHGATPAARNAAHARLAGIDSATLTDLYDRSEAQTGFVPGFDIEAPGIAWGKAVALPDGDPQKAGYFQQRNDLIDLETGSGSLYRDGQWLNDALHLPPDHLW